MLKSFMTILAIVCVNCACADYSPPYDLHLNYTPGKSSKVMILAHGMGGNYTLDETIKIDKTLVSFNFPDYNFDLRAIDVNKTTFGTINELLPLIYVIKKCVLIDGHQEIDLYGFSAGGGAIINAIGVLNSTRYDENLKELGIFQKEKKLLLQAIQKGLIILDTPLKSVSEIIAFRGHSTELDTFAKRYLENDMEPIDALKYLKGLSLNIILHFQTPDEILSNRDDELYYNRLKSVNASGKTVLINGQDNGHIVPHPTLWAYYKKLINTSTSKGGLNE